MVPRKILTRSGLISLNTARQSHFNVVRTNQVNVVKASACWVWRPIKPNSASITLKRYDYVDVRGRFRKPLKKQYDDLRTEFNKSEFNLVVLNVELEELIEKKESNKLKLNKFENASKSLDKLMRSQISDKSRKGVGFENDGAPTIMRDWVSDDEEQDESKPNSEKKTVIPTVKNIEFIRPKQQEKSVRKPVKYAEMYSVNLLIEKRAGAEVEQEMDKSQIQDGIVGIIEDLNEELLDDFNKMNIKFRGGLLGIKVFILCIAKHNLVLLKIHGNMLSVENCQQLVKTEENILSNINADWETRYAKEGNEINIIDGVMICFKEKI
ncbi:hypothetical protein Tco_1112917 [Tanacetum coccineum]|uniref:Uncharacterized protein n=1 Tax=Tanacetum coccineum TaxID=301880 RepID=A0ABQ5IUD5_9ASTR